MLIGFANYDDGTHQWVPKMRIIDFFDRGATFYPENIAFLDATGRLSYLEAQTRTHLIASALHSRAFGRGTHVGILAPNSNIALLALLGIFRTGAVCLPINPRDPVAVNSALLTRFDGELLLYHSVYEADARKIAGRVANNQPPVCIDDNGDFGESLSDWMCEAEPFFTAPNHSVDDAFWVFPTGGSTGSATDVVLNHRNAAASFANFPASFHCGNNCRHLVVAPMTHPVGVLACLYFARGGTNVIMATVDPGGILRAIQEHGITHLFVPPKLLYVMLNHPYVKLFDYSSLQHFIIGPAPASQEQLRQAANIFGPVMTQVHGRIDDEGVTIIVDRKFYSRGKGAGVKRLTPGGKVMDKLM